MRWNRILYAVLYIIGDTAQPVSCFFEPKLENRDPYHWTKTKFRSSK